MKRKQKSVTNLWIAAHLADPIPEHIDAAVRLLATAMNRTYKGSK